MHKNSVKLVQNIDCEDLLFGNSIYITTIATNKSVSVQAMGFVIYFDHFPNYS